MKIILLQDERKLGKKGDLVEVSDGYARNYIIPKKIGIEATAKNLNDLKMKKASEDYKAQQQLEQARALAEDIGQKQVVVSIKAGEGGKVFGSVSSKEIAQACKEQYGLEIDKKKIVLNENLKSFGAFKVEVRLYPGVSAVLNVQVVEKK